jgi:hypothetical protein
MKHEQRITIAVEDDSDSWRAQLMLEKHNRATLTDAPHVGPRLVLERLAKVEALLDLPDPELQGLRHRVIRLRKGVESSLTL